jgi:hypothetical protein
MDKIPRTGTAKRKQPLSIQERLDLFDAATRRQVARDKGRRQSAGTTGRGWKREDLYDRGR